MVTSLATKMPLPHIPHIPQRTPRSPTQPTEPTSPTQPTEPTSPAQPVDAGNVLAQHVRARRRLQCTDFGSNEKAVDAKPARNLAVVGLDKMDVPRGHASPDEGMRWIYLTTNLRFVAIYLQGPPPPAPATVRVREQTDLTHAHDRGWMDIAPRLEGTGWGLAPVYVAQCVTRPIEGQRMNEQVGRAHARHAKDLMALLADSTGFDLAGAVVYVDNEDQYGVQSPKGHRDICLLPVTELPDYLAYYRGFAEELATPDKQQRAYRFGLYARAAPARQIIGVVPNTYHWQVTSDTMYQHDLSELLGKAMPAPVTVRGVIARAPQRQIWIKTTGASTTDGRTWPVLRQACLGTHFKEKPVKPPFSMDDEIDIDASYVFDPSEPIATPRLAYLPGTTMLVRLRGHLARYNHDYHNWQHTTLKHVRRGSISIVEAGHTIKQNVAAVDVPTPTDPEQLHPESPIATACDSLGRLLVAAVRRNRTVVIGEVVKDARRPMEVVPNSGPARRPLALGLAALKEDAVVAYPTRTHEIRLHTKHWPDGTWASQNIAGPGTLHPLCGFAASAFASGDHVFLASITPNGHLFAATWTSTGANIIPPAKNAPGLCVTSAVAAVSPTADDDLAFAIDDQGQLVMTWFNPKTSKKWGFEFDMLAKRLFIHSRLGVTVENPDRVHVAAIDIDGEVRRWGVVRARSGGFRLEDSLKVGRGKADAPNPWSDIALTYVPNPLAAYVAVAGVDEDVDDPEKRTKAFRAPMLRETVWTPISND